MTRKVLFLLLLNFALLLPSAWSQVVETARHRLLSLSVGGLASGFQPNSVGEWAGTYSPIAERSPYYLFGYGVYVDFQLTKWIQLEAEGRWLHLNQYRQITQDNYFIGPRVPVVKLGRFNVYGKALVGLYHMNFTPINNVRPTGTNMALAFGGGTDIKLSRKIIFRPLDIEYQYWPVWGTTSLKPYGLSSGLAYRFF